MAYRPVHQVSQTAARGQAAQLTQPQVLAKNKKVPVNVIMQGLVTRLEIAAEKEVNAFERIAQSKRGEAAKAKQARVDDVARCLNLAVEAGADSFK